MESRSSKQLVSTEALASVLDVAAQQVALLFKQGRLPGYRVGKRQVRFDVDECIEALRVDAAAEANRGEGAA